MKKFLSFLLVLLACATANTTFAQNKAVGQQMNVAAPTTQISGRQNLARTIIALPDLQAGQEAALEAQLKAMPGVTRVFVETNQKQVVMAYDKAATDINQIETGMRAMNIKMEVIYPAKAEKVTDAPKTTE